MGNKVKNVIIFISGAAVGAAGMFVYIKKKWQKKFDDKRDEMINYYENKEPKVKEEVHEDLEDIDPEEIEAQEKTIDEAVNIIHKNKYNYSAISSPERTKNEAPEIFDETIYEDVPYQIDAREFGSQEGYGMVTLYLYNDGEVRSDKQEVLNDEDLEIYIGQEMLHKMADERDIDPEMDSFYVRNDRLKTDYEILIESGEV